MLLQFKLEGDLELAIKAEAQRIGISVTTVIRVALAEKFLKQQTAVQSLPTKSSDKTKVPSPPPTQDEFNEKGTNMTQLRIDLLWNVEVGNMTEAQAKKSFEYHGGVW